MIMHNVLLSEICEVGLLQSGLHIPSVPLVRTSTLQQSLAVVSPSVWNSSDLQHQILSSSLPQLVFEDHTF